MLVKAEENGHFEEFSLGTDKLILIRAVPLQPRKRCRSFPVGLQAASFHTSHKDPGATQPNIYEAKLCKLQNHLASATI